MLNIFIFLIQLILLYFFYRVYFIFIIDYINLFFISEIKIFLLEKFNFKVSYAMENDLINKNLQQQSYSLNDFEDKQCSYDRKEKILVTIGFVIVTICIYIFFKNNFSSVDQMPVVFEQLPQVTEQVIPVYENLEFVQNVLNESWNLDPLLKKSILNFKSTFSVQTVHNTLRIDLAQSLLIKNPEINFQDPFQEAQRLIDLYKIEINNFIYLKRNNV